jgi:Sortase domain
MQKIIKKVFNKITLSITAILLLITLLTVTIGSSLLKINHLSLMAFFQNSSTTSNNQSQELSAVSTSQSSAASSSKAPQVQVDVAGEQLTKIVENLHPSYRMGRLSSTNLAKLNIDFPVPFDGPKIIERDLDKNDEYKPLSSYYDKLENCENKNQLSVPDYGITAPIQYIDYKEMFGKNSDGSINFGTIPEYEHSDAYGDINHPMQKKLEKGIIHLTPISPLPGEIGNSYIAGHSSNWEFIKSDYNYIFRPLMQRTKEGDTFSICNLDGKKLNFKIFENLTIEEEDITTAYKSFGQRRIVTLQTSIMSYRQSNGWKPYQRWLAIGELQLPQ